MFKLSLLLLFVSNLDVSEGKSYQFINEKLTWQEAFAMCQKKGGMLATIESESEQLAAQKFLLEEIKVKALKPNFECFESSHNEVPFWIAGQKLDRIPESSFFWKLPNNQEKPLKYANWIEGQPDGSGIADTCIDMALASDFKWLDAPCSWNICALCQMP